MSSHIGTMRQDATGLEVDVYEGWSWPCFFFGAFWYLAKGMWGVGLLWLLLAIVTGSVLHWVGILYFASVANRQYREHLGSRGYTTVQRSAAEMAAEAQEASEQRTGYYVLGGVALVVLVIAIVRA